MVFRENCRDASLRGYSRQPPNLMRIMNRRKALCRRWAIPPGAGRDVYYMT